MNRCDRCRKMTYGVHTCTPTPYVRQLEQQNAMLLELIRKIAEQTPEKPDYWSSCSQCEHNISEAEDVIAAVKGGAA